ncbi:hypothetical protein EDC01DRAFT_644667 [Geopyxis carbonaria]|nr:hypothetical protein EDC01DRAFT_644667 [Geopyxis carbonaria]
MWLLSCDDKEAMGGVRIWVRPGSRCVLGRVKHGEVTVAVSSHKSISRTHLIINVAAVHDEDGIRIHTRSQVTLQDNNTKHGTMVDGVSIKGKPKVLDRLEHTFTLGKHEATFRIKWEPVVLSFSLLGKEKKDKNAMVPHRHKVEALDIKTIATWTDATTHIVATKRNTAIGLQALINGRYIVAASYLDAIVAAAALPPKTGDVTPLSPLEVDFDAHWPRVVDYLPPKGKEPTAWPPEKFLPDAARNNMFEGWTFVFCDEAQYQTLLAPITDAGGKIDRFVLEHKKTIAPDIAQFVTKKGRGDEVAVVSFANNYKADPKWAEDLIAETQELLGFQMVQQNTFLDMILTMDKSGLRKPLEPSMRRTQPATQASSAAPETVQDMQAPAVPIKEASVEPESAAGPRGRRARTRRPVMTDFSFDLGGDLLPAPTPVPETQIPAASAAAPTQAEAGGDTTMGFTQLPTQMEVDESPSIPPSSSEPPVSQYPPAQSQLKRPHERSPEAEYKSTNVMDLLPGSRVIKRRKIAEEQERVARGETAVPTPPAPEPAEVAVKAEPPPSVKKPKAGRSKKPAASSSTPTDTPDTPDTPFASAARTLRAEASAAAASQDRRDAASASADIDVTALRNLALVEFVPLKPRTDVPRRSAPGDDPARWREEWNGRKNFKGFRRAGRSGAMRSAAGKVLIGVVEHRGRDYGIGDGYWVDDNASAAGGRRSQVAVGSATPGERRGEREGTVASVASVASEVREGSVTPRRAVSVAGSKRRIGAAAAVRGGKRQRTVIRAVSDEESGSDGGESEDSDDDGLKFRLRRR